MKKEKKLLLDTLIYGISSLGSKSLSFILLPIYSYYFTKEQFGEWDLISTTISLLIPLISLEIPTGIYRWLLESKTLKEKKEIISTGYWFNFKSILIFSIIYFLFIKIIFNKYIYSIYFMIILSQIDIFILNSLRGILKNKEFAIIGIIKSIFSFILAIYFIYVLNLKIEVFIYTSIISSIVGIILGGYFLKIHQYIKRRYYSKKIMKELRNYTIPLIPGAINWWFMNVSDRYIIVLFLGLTANGLYSMANKFPAILNIVNSVFYMAWQDNALREYNNKDKNLYYSKVFKYYSRIMFFTITILVLYNKTLLELFLSAEYSSTWKYSNLLYIATLFSFFSSFWGIGFHGEKNTKIILYTTLIGAIINVTLNIIFIKNIGLYAACISTILCYLVMWLLRIKKSKNFKIIIEKKEFTIMLLLLIAIFILVNLNVIYNKEILLVILLVYFFINLKEIYTIKKKYIRNYL